MATAILNGTLIDDGGLVCEVRFDWGLTGAYGNTTPWLPGYYTGMTFQERIYNLPGGGITVYFRAVARNALGTTYGALQTFVTIPRAPIVITDPATQISTTEATLNATIIDDMGAGCQIRFEYGGTPGYGNKSDWVSGFLTGASLAMTIAGLSPGRSYQFRAVAENIYGRGYGANVTFTTLNDAGARTGFPLELALLLEEM